MAQQPELATDHLLDVITTIKMERRSGQLVVRRGSGLTAEDGTFLFVQGQVTHAQVGKRIGSDALNWLSTWRQASYVFIPAIAPSETSLHPPQEVPPALSDVSIYPYLDLNIVQQSGPAVSLEYHNAIPYATVKLIEATDRFEHAQLARSYRHLYLLIDGQRSVSDLARMTGRAAEVVHSMLYDLHRLGVIRIASRSLSGQ